MKISVLTPSIRPEGLRITQQCLKEQTFQDFEWIQEIGLPYRGYDLNRAYNKMLKRAQGELIVSYQDCIKVTPDYLQKFWDAYEEAQTTLFTAPVGKVTSPDFTGDIRWDWRAWTDGEKNPRMRPCNWDCWEIDSAAAPRQMFYDIGGFDEVLDQWWSFDNVSVGKRAEMAGYKFKNLFSNPAIAFDHDLASPNPMRENFKPALVKLRMEEYTDNYKLGFL